MFAAVVVLFEYYKIHICYDNRKEIWFLSMVVTERPPVVIPPSYTFFFEQAEHLLDRLALGKLRFSTRQAIHEVTQTQRDGASIVPETVCEALALPAVQKRIRLGMILHQEQLEAMNRISVNIHQCQPALMLPTFTKRRQSR